MAAAAERRLLGLTLREHFGPTTEVIGLALIKAGRLTLRATAAQIRVAPEKVRQCALVLMQHQLLVPHATRGPLLEYQVLPDSVLRILRYPRYVVVGRNV